MQEIGGTSVNVFILVVGGIFFTQLFFVVTIAYAVYHKKLISLLVSACILAEVQTRKVILARISGCIIFLANPCPISHPWCFSLSQELLLWQAVPKVDMTTCQFCD